MYQKYYTRFLEAHKNVIHLAAHSHHFWPDVTREAQIKYWEDSCRLVDDKWSYFFSNPIPQVQKHIAKLLKISNPQQIAFAGNTHEFVMRLFSCFNQQSKKTKILTTDSEFYSFERQAQRLQEENNFEVIKVPTEPYQTFADRFIQSARDNNPDLIFFSHVFFNSGWACPLHQILPNLPDHSIKVVDAYHSFMALPTDWSPFEKDVFYLGGSYKYAQGGEGCCFLYVPPECQLRPSYTGWFAELSQLARKDNQVSYPDNGMRFAGSTMDMSALYRLLSVFELFQSEKLDIKLQHLYIQNLQKYFLNKLESSQHLRSLQNKLIFRDWEEQGHFLTFQLSSAEETENRVKELRSVGIWTDSRRDRIRFGFGLYLVESDFDRWL